MPETHTVPITGDCIFDFGVLPYPEGPRSPDGVPGCFVITSNDMNTHTPISSDSGELRTKFDGVTPHMVRSRTVELALNAGRNSFEIRQRDYEQAKRELTGETDFDRQQAMLYSG